MTKKLTPEILSVNPLPSLLWPRLLQGPLSCTGESLPRSQRGFATAAQQGSKQCTWSPDLLRRKIPRRGEGGSLRIVLPSPCCSEERFLDQWHQHTLGAPWKCRISGPPRPRSPHLHLERMPR